MIVLSGAEASAVEGVVFSPSNRRIAFALPQQVEVWDLTNTAAAHTLQTQLRYPAAALQFRTDTTLLLGGKGYSIASQAKSSGRWRVRRATHVDVPLFALSPRTKDWVVMAYGSLFTLRRYDWEGQNDRWDSLTFRGTPSPTKCNGLAIFVDEKHFVSVESSFVIRDSNTGRQIRTVPFPVASPVDPQFSTDERLFAVRSGNRICVCAATPELPEQRILVNDAAHHFTGIAFHPSGRFLAATSNDATVKLYDTTTWEVARTFTWDIGKMRSVAFSPDGTLAAVGSDSGKVVVWDVDL